MSLVVRLSFGIVVGVLIALDVSDAAKILCVFLTPSISHQLVFRGLSVALNERGHELIIVTVNPLRDTSRQNYTEIDAQFLYEKWEVGNWIELRTGADPLDLITEYNKLCSSLADLVLGIPEFRRIYEPSSEERFDLVLMEMQYWHALYPLVRRFDAPWIGITSLGLDLNAHYVVGNPIVASHPATWEFGRRVSEPVTFWNRLKDFVEMWRYVYAFRTNTMQMNEIIARKHFGDYGTTLTEIERNVSLIFSNQQLPISFARPIGPQVIDIGGFHIEKEIKPLPEELKKFLDEAREGFVYASLGTNAKSTMLPRKTREAFVTAFSRLPFRVLWKFEENFLPGKPDNVFVMKWIPQQAVLAHPNIRAFVYQGGLQSTEEAIFHAVPLIGIPVLGDQDSQVQRMVSIGVCKQLEITNLNANDLIEAVTTVATDSSFKQRMQNLRALIADKPYDTMNHAVWWIEHVIRHRGTPYLASSTADLPWYQRGDIDLVAFITGMFIITTGFALFISFRMSIRLYQLFSVSKKDKVN